LTERARVARAAFPHGNRSNPLRDALGSTAPNRDGADRSPNDGAPAIAPAPLARTTVLLLEALAQLALG